MTRRLPIALAIGAIAIGVYATSAPGARHVAPQRDRQLASVQRQVRVLQTQVRALQGRMGQVVWTLEMIEKAMTDGETCFAALTADELQNTWSQMDQLAVHLGAEPVFGTQTPVGDDNACRDLSISRPLLNPSVAPSVAALEAFIHWRKG